MAWAVTLKLTDCANGAAVVGFVSDGVTTHFTDSFGQFIAVIDDFYSGYIVSLSANNYINKTFHIDRAQHAGTIQTVCLNRATVTPPNGDGW